MSIDIIDASQIIYCTICVAPFSVEWHAKELKAWQCMYIEKQIAECGRTKRKHQESPMGKNVWENEKDQQKIQKKMSPIKWYAMHTTRDRKGWKTCYICYHLLLWWCILHSNIKSSTHIARIVSFSSRSSMNLSQLSLWFSMRSCKRQTQSTKSKIELSFVNGCTPKWKQIL